MSKRIFLHPLDINRITQAFTLKVKSEILGLTPTSDGKTALVVAESNKSETEVRIFIRHGTGQAMEDHEKYIGSYIDRIGHVVHVCEQLEKSGWPDV